MGGRARTRARGCGLQTGHERAGDGRRDLEKKRFKHQKSTVGMSPRPRHCHATVTPLCSTFSFFHSHSLSVHCHPSITSNVSRRGLFSPTHMHGQSRYVNYIAFTDGFLTPIPCLLTLACPQYRRPRHTRVRVQRSTTACTRSTPTWTCLTPTRAPSIPPPSTPARTHSTPACTRSTFSTHAYVLRCRCSVQGEGVWVLNAAGFGLSNT